MSPNDVVETGGGGVDGHLLDCLKILFCIENYELLVWTLILEFKIAYFLLILLFVFKIACHMCNTWHLLFFRNMELSKKIKCKMKCSSLRMRI